MSLILAKNFLMLHKSVKFHIYNSKRCARTKILNAQTWTGVTLALPRVFPDSSNSNGQVIIFYGRVLTHGQGIKS